MARSLPDFDTFARRARELADSYPREIMEGIEAVDVHQGVKSHPFLDGIVTLGECETSPLSQLVQEEAFRSRVHIYYGSFVDIARRDPSFDIEAELDETLRHEVRHHIEDRAGLRALLEEDDLFEAHARFRAGLEVPPGWYRHGERHAPGLWSVDLDLFLELDLRRSEFAAQRGRPLVLDVLGQPVEVELPADAEPEEVFTVEGAGLFEPDEALEEGAEPDEDTPGTAGDLHIVPRVR